MAKLNVALVAGGDFRQFGRGLGVDLGLPEGGEQIDAGTADHTETQHGGTPVGTLDAGPFFDLTFIEHGFEVAKETCFERFGFGRESLCLSHDLFLKVGEVLGVGEIFLKEFHFLLELLGDASNGGLVRIEKGLGGGLLVFA